GKVRLRVHDAAENRIALAEAPRLQRVRRRARIQDLGGKEDEDQGPGVAVGEDVAQSLADRHLWRRPPTGDHMTHQLDGLRLCFGQPNPVRSSPKPPHRFRSYRKHLELHSGQTLQEPHPPQTRPLPQADTGYPSRMTRVFLGLALALAI